MRRYFLIWVTLTLAASVVAGPAAGQGVEVQAADTTPGTSTDFSLRYIPEALPLSGSQGSPRPTGLLQEADTESVRKELSATRAVLYSLLLPGLGDYYAGKKSRATAFFIVDAALWTTLVVFQVQGHQREDSYQEYAARYAGVTGTDHSDDFYSAVGRFNSSNDYEADFKKESRPDLWPDVGYDAMEQNYLENRIADFEEWAWLSSDLRVEYRHMRSDSKLAYRRSEYVIPLLVANRIVASIFAYHAVRWSRGKPGTQTGQYGVDFSIPPFGAPGEYATAVSVVRSF